MAAQSNNLLDKSSTYARIWTYKFCGYGEALSRCIYTYVPSTVRRRHVNYVSCARTAKELFRAHYTPSTQPPLRIGRRLVRRLGRHGPEHRRSTGRGLWHDRRHRRLLLSADDDIDQLQPYLSRISTGKMAGSHKRHHGVSTTACTQTAASAASRQPVDC